MKNITQIILITILSITLFACSNDDDEGNDDYSINGTSWIGTGDTDSNRSITFTSANEYLYIEPGAGGHNEGTYTFSNKSGVLTDSYGTTPFTINNDLLVIDYDKGTGGYIDTNGIETFIKQ
jgi:hypothetical protein